MTSLYEPLGDDRFGATALTRGPWFAEAQHGGPPAALFMRQIENVPSPVPMEVARFTMNLLRPIPVAEVRVTAAPARPGRRVQMVTAEMTAGGEVVATAEAWRFAARQGLTEASPPIRDAGVPEPDPERNDGRLIGFDEGFHEQAVRIHQVQGGFRVEGRSKAWFRLVAPLLPGEDLSPAQRAVAISDFSNGLGSQFGFDTHLFVNTDLTVSFGRPPTGEWILLDAETITGGDGYGHSIGRLADGAGQFAHATQSLLIEPR